MEQPTRSTLESVAGILNEAFMGFLAILALGTSIGPLVFTLGRGTEHALDRIEMVILGLFVAEFFVQLLIAPDRARWLRSPWRIVDVICIVGPLIALLPWFSDAYSGAFALRLLRVGRAVMFGARAGTVAVRDHHHAAAARAASETTVSIVSVGHELRSEASDWAAFLGWTREPTPAWYHASSIGYEQFADLVRAAGLAEKDLAHFLDPRGKPRINNYTRHTAIVLWLPTVTEDGFPEVKRNRILALVDEKAILTASWSPFDLPSSISRLAQREALPSVGFPAKITYAILTLARDRNAFVAHRHEEELRRLEEVRLHDGGPEFLQEAFHLRRELSAAAADLWRLKGIVRAFADGKAPLRGADAKNELYLDNLMVDTDNLHRQVEELKDSLQSLIELHMNVRSFEMNKFMKLLAVASFLGLIPAVVGGLLGMNVDGNPWHVTLGQVAFGVVMGMAISLYIFAIKGWLR
jgi:Mg2+ and Co2+ transporter CorA